MCTGPFANEQAMKQHKKSPLYVRMLARANHVVKYVVRASFNPDNVGSISWCGRSLHLTKQNPVHERRPPLRSRKARPAAPSSGGLGRGSELALCNTDCGY